MEHGTDQPRAAWRGPAGWLACPSRPLPRIGESDHDVGPGGAAGEREHDARGRGRASTCLPTLCLAAPPRHQPHPPSRRVPQVSESPSRRGVGRRTGWHAPNCGHKRGKTADATLAIRRARARVVFANTKKGPPPTPPPPPPAHGVPSQSLTVPGLPTEMRRRARRRATWCGAGEKGRKGKAERHWERLSCEVQSPVFVLTAVRLSGGLTVHPCFSRPSVTVGCTCPCAGKVAVGVCACAVPRPLSIPNGHPLHPNPHTPITLPSALALFCEGLPSPRGARNCVTSDTPSACEREARAGGSTETKGQRTGEGGGCCYFSSHEPPGLSLARLFSLIHTHTHTPST
jgi:hypothetical protein